MAWWATVSVILASASPRRRELLSQILRDFAGLAADIDETPHEDESATDYVCRMSEEKAKRVWLPGRVVLGADTTVVCNGAMLHKPMSSEQARGMLRSLSGQRHEVMTSVSLMSDSATTTQRVTTRVEFTQLSPRLIEAYLQTQEPWDKAGAYAIQGLAASFVKRIEGSYTAVVGLPLSETRDMLEIAGIETGVSGSHV